MHATVEQILNEIPDWRTALIPGNIELRIGPEFGNNPSEGSPE
jgi:hypothetical protein